MNKSLPTVFFLFALAFTASGCVSAPPGADMAQWTADRDYCWSYGESERKKNATFGSDVKNYAFGIFSILTWSEDDKSSPKYGVKVANDCMVAKGWPAPF